jgi:hypothetical protein
MPLIAMPNEIKVDPIKHKAFYVMTLPKEEAMRHCREQLQFLKYLKKTFQVQDM